MANGIGTEGYVANEMYDRINYGNNGGGLYTGNSVLAANAHADGTAMKEAIDCNSTRFSDGLNTLSGQFSNINNANRFDRLNENISDAEFRSDSKFSTLNKNISDSEFRTIDRNRDIESLAIAGQKEQAACCCETQKQMAAGFAATQLEASKNQGALLLKMCEDKNEISKQIAEQSALILAVEARGNLDKLAESRAENTYLKTIAELGNRRA